MMEIKKMGWFLSDSALKTLDSKASAKIINSSLLNKDLREIGAGCSELHKGKLENIENDLVILQILKLRNLSAPKANENSKTAPKLLKLQLTDGQNSYSAIEMEPISALSLENTPPGTKISLKVKQLKIINGQLLLTPKNIEILGGHVESLVSKWEISRSLANQMKGNRSGGAPPFIPFGQKIQQNIENDKSFKSLASSKQKEHEENSEFNAQRQDAIAEASKVGTRKTFGGGNKTLVDSNVQKIMDKGFSEEQATTALKFARNNVEKALSNLKRREERQQRGTSNEYESRNENVKEKRNSEDRRENKGGRGASSDMPTAKPSTGVSLFDFLEKKIPESSTAKASSYDRHNERFENNISSSFRKHDKDGSSNKSHWSQQQQYSSSASSEYKSSQKNSYNSSRNDYHANEPASREYRDYKGNSSNYRERNENKDYKNQQYQQRNGGNNNYSAKTNSTTNNNNRDYSKSNASTSNQKPNTAPPSSTYNNNNNNNNRNSGNAREGKYGQKSDYNSSARSNQSKDYSNAYSSSGGGDGSSYHAKSRSNNNNNESYHSNKSQGRDIAESMEKMILKNNQQKNYKGYDRHAPPPSSNATTTSESKHQTYSAPASNNYPTVGFQSKEGNEKAKNALKTKSIPTQQASNWHQQPQQQAIPPFQNAAVQPQSHQMHTMAPPQTFVQHPVMAMAPPQGAVFQPITYQAAPPIIMQSVPTHLQPPTGIPSQLKINDPCLAKYWEDGKFYNAKITGVSESTYVVLFTEYGNAEEVRKTDCVPVPLVVPTCPTPPSYHHPVQAAATHMTNSYRVPTQKMPPQLQQQQHGGYHSQLQQQQSMPSAAYKGGPKRRN